MVLEISQIYHFITRIRLDRRTCCMQDTFARARTRPSARDDRVSCIQSHLYHAGFDTRCIPLLTPIPRTAPWPVGRSARFACAKGQATCSNAGETYNIVSRLSIILFTILIYTHCQINGDLSL